MTSEAARALASKLLPHSPSLGFFVAPEIPPKKLRNASKAYASETDPEVASALALFDATLFGSGKEGFLLTAATLYWRASSERGAIPFARLEGAHFEAEGEWLHIDWFEDEVGHRTRTGRFPRALVPDLLEFLDLMRARGDAQDDASAPAPATTPPTPQGEPAAPAPRLPSRRQTLELAAFPALMTSTAQALGATSTWVQEQGAFQVQLAVEGGRSHMVWVWESQPHASLYEGHRIVTAQGVVGALGPGVDLHALLASNMVGVCTRVAVDEGQLVVTGALPSEGLTTATLALLVREVGERADALEEHLFGDDVE